MTPLDIANRYFELSNASDFAGIARLLCDTTTYRSGDGKFFLGAHDIMAMQRAYHGSFNQLLWTVTEVAEVDPGIVRLEFDFSGENDAGERIVYSGVEHVLAKNGVIVHIDVVRHA